MEDREPMFRLRMKNPALETPEVRAWLDELTAKVNHRTEVTHREEWELMQAEIRDAMTDWAVLGTIPDWEAIMRRYEERMRSH